MQRHSQLSLALLVTAAALAAVGGQPPTDAPAKQSAAKPETIIAVQPKPLQPPVEKGLEYLVNQQQENGGWGQGGGWRNNLQNGGRVEGAKVADPADVANTCIAALALLRAGHTPHEGKYAKNVAKAVDFICKNVEKADAKSLFVTEIKGTQVQGKIGPYVDTFLTSLVLAELKGRMPDEASEKRLVAALNKTIGKIETNQKADGTFVGNDAWAPVFSQGLAAKGLNRAIQNGGTVSSEVLARAEKNAAQNFDAKEGAFAAASPAPAMAGAGKGGAVALARGGPAGSGRATALGLGGGVAMPGDAGIPIYNISNTVAGMQESVNTNRVLATKARQVLAKPDATKADKDKAQADLKRFDEAEKTCEQAMQAVVKRLKDQRFIQGFGSNGGEEFLSYMNISEALVVKGGADWEAWDRAMADNLTRIQDKEGSWSGNHCITGKTFCTATALLVLMADRAPVPVAAKMKTGR